MRKIALDLGTKTCGFAITDELNIIATGIENFTYSNNDFSIVLKRLEYWLKFYEYKIDKIILGFPTNATDGSYNQRTYMVLDFKKYIEDNLSCKIDVILHDERFTTKIATEFLKKEGKLKASKIKKIKDKMSAVVILSDYMNFN